VEACLQIILDNAPLVCYVEAMKTAETNKTCKTCKGYLIGAEVRGERCNACLDRAAFACLAEQHEIELERVGGCYGPEGEGVQA